MLNSIEIKPTVVYFKVSVQNRNFAPWSQNGHGFLFVALIWNFGSFLKSVTINEKKFGNQFIVGKANMAT